MQGKFTNIDVSQIYSDLNNIILKENPDFQPFNSTSSFRQRKANRKRLTSFLIKRYIQSARRSERDIAVGNAISHRYLNTVEIENQYIVEVALINGLIRKLVLNSPPVRTLEEKGKHVIRCIFLKIYEGR